MWKSVFAFVCSCLLVACASDDGETRRDTPANARSDDAEDTGPQDATPQSQSAEPVQTPVSPAYVVPVPVSEDGRTFEFAEDTLAMTVEGIDGVAPGNTSPEAAAVHFFASQMRGDERFLEVVPNPVPARLQAGLDRLGQVKITKVVFVKRVLGFQGAEAEVQVRLDLVAGSETIEGDFGKVMLESTDQGWLVTRVPG